MIPEKLQQRADILPFPEKELKAVLKALNEFNAAMKKFYALDGTPADQRKHFELYEIGRKQNVRIDRLGAHDVELR